MKQLQATGEFVRKQAQPIDQQEDLLWKKGLLGDSSPQTLFDTVVFYIGLCFALRSGVEHRHLRHVPCQIELVEPIQGIPYLIYREDVSKTNQGGLDHRKRERKEVIHYANQENPEKCLVRLFKLYQSKCPPDRPDGAFYLKPLEKPKSDIWFSWVALGHNTLSKTVQRLCKEAGIPGYFTNHSLRTTAATRLFDAGIDEQLIMGRTGHHSVDGVRSYKRVTENLKMKTSDVTVFLLKK